jgi:hypothetical protein
VAVFERSPVDQQAHNRSLPVQHASASFFTSAMRAPFFVLLKALPRPAKLLYGSWLFDLE